MDTSASWWWIENFWYGDWSRVPPLAVKVGIPDGDIMTEMDGVELEERLGLKGCPSMVGLVKSIVGFVSLRLLSAIIIFTRVHFKYADNSRKLRHLVLLDSLLQVALVWLAFRQIEQKQREMRKVLRRKQLCSSLKNLSKEKTDISVMLLKSERKNND